jgi:hypothetical protein
MTCPSTPSDDLAVGTTTVVAYPARLMNLILFGGSAVSTVIVYDNASTAAGTVLARFNVAANTTWSDHFGEGLIANAGCSHRHRCDR